MTKKGLDLSHFNGVPDFKKVKAAGIDFVMIKATEGSAYKYVDYFRNQAPLALGNGLDVGAYHFGTFSTVPEAITEARYFLSVIKPFKLTYPVVLDIEQNKEKVSKKQLTDACIAFLEVLENAGYFAMWYSFPSFIEYNIDEDRMSPYALWYAFRGTEAQLDRDVAMWQYTDSGKVDGIGGNVDMNIAYLDFASIIKDMSKPAYQTYTVRSGESLIKIAARMGTTVQHLLLLNPSIKNKDVIFAGQKIKVPVR